MTLVSDCKDKRLTEDAYTYHAAENESLSAAVIQAVAAFANISPIVTDRNEGDTVLKPLYEAIDPDALDALFHTMKDEAPTPGVVEFMYCGYEVTVTSTGVVMVTGE
ncbi:HalOD1 output domain-containing protein [Haladaptatus halobius]|uniref:HalOD1 output domain-containing protein n=1 Tax=Haladaptatus halobius TaxID=2884875 RepID=UPI001D0AEFCC|nr:HalOD1 output domain-containing protein [Haladaptatus halobius]